ncbi:MAG: hypothetical protein PHO30_00330 [Candidatus Omnitrophica bacterium]|nr:hypothetical protein [Candidatus Omnitrophota bacterium]
MNKVKKLGKGLEDISYLFLSSEQENDASRFSSSQPVTRDPAVPSLPTKSVCLIGNSADMRDAFLIINLSLALARLGMRIAVVDMDEGFPCINFFLGKNNEAPGLGDSNELIRKGPLGVQLAGLDRNMLKRLSDSREKSRMLEQLEAIEANTDLIIVSISQDNLRRMEPVLRDVIREFLVIVPPQKEPMLDSYRAIKRIFSHNPLAKIGVIITDIAHMYEVEAVYTTMAGAVRKFLDKELYKYGFLFSVKQEMDAKANIASFYDADLTACISNIAQIVVLRLNPGESGTSAGLFFRKITADYFGVSKT